MLIIHLEMNLNNNYHSTLSQCREEENDNETEEDMRTFLPGGPRKASISSSNSSRTEIVQNEEEQQPLKQQKSFAAMLKPSNSNKQYKNGLQRKNTWQIKAKGNSLTVPKVSLVKI